MKKFYLEKIDSTNTYAKKNIEKFEDKSVVYTYCQTAGRGRFERKWVQLGSRNLYMTIILHPDKKFITNLANLTQYLSVITCKVLEEYGISPKIKWPNDVLVNGKKISGILSEAVFQGERFLGLAIGIGINLNITPEDTQKVKDKIITSLNLEIAKEVSPEEILEKLCEKFFAEYDKFILEGFSIIKNDYKNYIVHIGEKITVKDKNKTTTGIFTNINDDGTLRLITDKGEENLCIGDII